MPYDAYGPAKGLPAAAQPSSPIPAASKTSAPAGAAKAAASASAPKVELPKARAVGRVETPPAEPAPVAASAKQILKAVAISPAETALENRDTDGALPADDGLGFLAEESSKSKRRAAPAVAAPSFVKDEPADDAAGDLASIAGLADRPSKSAPAYRPKKKKKGFPTWLIPTIAAAGVGAVVLIVAVVWMNQQSTSTSGSTVSSASSSTTPGVKNAGPAEPKPTPKGPLLVIDWPEGERTGGVLFVDGDKQEVPPTGPIKIPLPRSKSQYSFRLERKGFEPKTFSRVWQEEDQDYTVKDWQPVHLEYIDWEEQDFDAAKKTAAGQKKNVFLLFDASDSKESSFASSRFRESIATSKEFRERAEKEYVCVYIDNPEKADAQGRVKDAERNRKLTEKFHINVFPTAVVTDPKGRPFGIMEDYKINGITLFLELMDKWVADRKNLADLLAQVDAMSKDSPDADLGMKFRDFLELNGLDPFYRGYLARFPKHEGAPVTKELADQWMQKFQSAAKNPDQAKKIVEEFDRWKKSKTFTNHDIGAKLHLIAALVLWRLHLKKEAIQKCDEGLAFKPNDHRTRNLLGQLSLFLSGKKGSMPVSSGSGFCIAEGNYVMTCYHVIRKAKKIQIHLNDDEERYPATLIGGDESGDVALLKIDLPAGKSLIPIPLVATTPKIGEEVCVMGWPGDLSENVSLTLTRGIVSTLVGPNDDERMIATDCKATHGDSGGPLCSANGVVGMISRGTSEAATAYGLSIPVERLRKFALANLPAAAKKLPTPASEAGLRLADRADIFQHSVVYIENLQEMSVQVQEQGR